VKFGEATYRRNVMVGSPFCGGTNSRPVRLSSKERRQ